ERVAVRAERVLHRITSTAVSAASMPALRQTARPMADLAGRRAIVTGGASGIGRAIAEDLAAQGARVLVTDVNAADGERVAKSIGGLFVRADMSRQPDCDAVVQRANKEWQGV